MAVNEPAGSGNSDRPEGSYLCSLCHFRFDIIQPGDLTRNCPNCSASFNDLRLTSECPEPDGHRFTPAVTEEHQGHVGVLSPPLPDGDSFDVNGVSDLLRQMHIHDDDNLHGNHFLSVHHVSPVTFSYTREYAGSGDDVEWDRILTWYFENESAFISTHVAGLSEEEIRSIPVSVLTSKDIIDKEPTCTICIEEFHLLEEVKNLSCEHFFHKGCIDPWLKMHANCPVCREIVKTDDCGRNFVMRLPADDANFIDVASASSSHESHHGGDYTYSASEVTIEHSFPYPTGRGITEGSRTHEQNPRSTNDVAIQDEQNFLGEPRSWHLSSSNGNGFMSGSYAPHSPSHGNQTGSFTLDRWGSLGSTISFVNDTFRTPGIIVTTRLCDPLAGSVNFSGISENTSTTQAPAGSHSFCPLTRQQSTSTSINDSNTGMYSLSNSSSLEDLSSIVPVLPPIVF